MPSAPALAFLLLLIASCPGCQPAGTGPADLGAPPPDAASALPPPVCVDGLDGGLPPTFATVQRIFNENCMGGECHSSGRYAAPVMLDLRAGHAFASTVGVTASETCDGGAPLTRIVPGDAGASFLYHKVHDPRPCAGDQMPRGETPYMLPDCEIAILRAWIDSGAKQ